jgi:hypothetical protein
MDHRPWWNVYKWPRWLRRVFVCTFPISGPLWVVCYVLGGVVFWMIAIPIAIFNTLVGYYWDDPPSTQNP